MIENYAVIKFFFINLGVTCKNLLAPDNGDIEYIIPENDRDDLSLVQVRSSTQTAKFFQQIFFSLLMKNFFLGWTQN